MLTAELVSALAFMVTALAGAVALLWRTRTETTVQLAELADKIARVHKELKPNSGSSARDAINRTEEETQGQTEMLAQVLRTVSELGRDMGGLRGDVRRLAQVDVEDRAKARTDHDQIWHAINTLQGRN